MTERLPRISGKDPVAALQRHGWRQVRQRGSHIKLRHPDVEGQVIVPVHAGEVVPVGTGSILSQAGVSGKELREML